MASWIITSTLHERRLLSDNPTAFSKRRLRRATCSALSLTWLCAPARPRPGVALARGTEHRHSVQMRLLRSSLPTVHGVSKLPVCAGASQQLPCLIRCMSMQSCGSPGYRVCEGADCKASLLCLLSTH